MTEESSPDKTETAGPNESVDTEAAPPPPDGADSPPPPPPDGADSPPPPPPGGTVRPRLLRRSRSDRVIGGVCGGIGNYFGVDPVIVRVIFVAIALFGGSGVLLYLIAWLVIAKEGRDESRAAQALRGSPEGNRGVVVVVLVVAGVLILTSPLIWWPTLGFGSGLALPLLILAAGVALLVWPDNGLDLHRRWHDEHRDDWEAARTEISEDLRHARRETREAWREARRDWRHGYRRGFGEEGPLQPPPPPAAPVPAPTPPPPPKPPKPRSFLGPLTLALLLLLTGGAAFADQVDWIDVDPAVFLGICLMVVGVVLVVSAFAGRARGLIFIGVLLLPVAWAVSTVDLTWWDGVGDEHYRVDSLDELEDEYRFGIGQLIVDLSDLDLEGQTQDVSVGLTIGEAIVYVPEGMHVDVDLDGRIGEMVVDLGITRYDDEGIDNSVDTEIGEPGNGTLNLDFDLGIGSGRVEVCSSTSEFGALPQCP